MTTLNSVNLSLANSHPYDRANLVEQTHQLQFYSQLPPLVIDPIITSPNLHHDNSQRPQPLTQSRLFTIP